MVLPDEMPPNDAALKTSSSDVAQELLDGHVSEVDADELTVAQKILLEELFAELLSKDGLEPSDIVVELKSDGEENKSENEGLPQRESLDNLFAQLVVKEGYKPDAVRIEVVRVETNGERQRQQKQEDDRQRAQQRREIAVDVLAVSVLFALVITSTLILLNPEPTLEKEKDWSRSFLTLLGGGVVGYLFGKSSSS